MTDFEIKTIDKNGRVAIPAPYREELGKEFVLSLSEETCLKGYTRAKWDEMIADAEEFDLNPRMLTRNAKQLVFDAQGRVTLPEKLLQKRKIGERIAIVGVGSYIEIWDADVWERSDEAESTQESIADFTRQLRELKRAAKNR